MTPANPDFRSEVARIFEAAAFVRDLGIRLESCDPGLVRSVVDVGERHLQHDGVVHAGVQTTLADHTAGAAAGSLVPAGAKVLSLEFKVHMLRPAHGPTLRCEARVIKPGRRFMIVEAEVFGDDREKPSCKLLGTMAVV